eukprot:COSAG03_NODE_478_length_7595_cov_4.439568_9_plen_318_part_00
MPAAVPPPPPPPASEWVAAARPLSIAAPEPEPEPGYLGALSGRWCTNDAGTALAETEEIVLDLPADSRVQIASDLHLEFIREGCGAEFDLDAVVTPTAPILALLGDIGIPTHPGYKRFLLHQAERFEAVLVLTGNHEFYDSVPPGPPPQPRDGEAWAAVEARHRARPRHGVEDMEQVIESLCALHPALHYVDNRVVRLGREVDAPALLCTPLWSHIPRAAMTHVGRCLNDYTMALTRPCSAPGTAAMSTGWQVVGPDDASTASSAARASSTSSTAGVWHRAVAAAGTNGRRGSTRSISSQCTRRPGRYAAAGPAAAS